MPVPHRRLDLDHSDSALAERIVRGALAGDATRMHDAIAVAVHLHGAAAAERSVFDPALRTAARFGSACRTAVAEAIDAHLHQRRTA
jgi:hypothetical protein